eukprot:TRINITY_DN801_c0_g1_i7.p1 TRINITY_DN801_c0_g1~~TRINITY_DN801_c0_g1_i7.p1  ORF type:complete len:101 (-),score=2.52 TRINITY_DN801_c0_g1_i7:34-336(-)
MVPGRTVYGEMHISVDQGGDAVNIEYNVWNLFRSKLAFRSKWAVVCGYYPHNTWLFVCILFTCHLALKFSIWEQPQILQSQMLSDPNEWNMPSNSHIVIT